VLLVRHIVALWSAGPGPARPRGSERALAAHIAAELFAEGVERPGGGGYLTARGVQWVVDHRLLYASGVRHWSTELAVQRWPVVLSPGEAHLDPALIAAEVADWEEELRRRGEVPPLSSGSQETPGA
jgi:hypothetical protein